MPCSLSGMFAQYKGLKILSVILLLYIATWSYAPVGTFGTTGGFVDINTGYVIDTSPDGGEERTEAGVILTKGTERAIVAESPLQMVCLGITRASAFFMYPSLVLLFTTKMRATMEVIASSGFAIWFYNDLHDLHVYCGWVVFIDGLLHTLGHIVRWADQGNLYLMFDHFSGISGFCIAICLVLISVPMAFEGARARMSYEVRKSMHYFFIPFCIALAFHAPFSTIPNGGFAPIIFPILIIWYTLDHIYVLLYMTEKIETSIFHVVPTGVQLTMQVSERFQQNANSGGYCYVCFPWIAEHEWHAYSLFENIANPSERQIYMQDLGDWTGKVRESLQRDTSRPVWVMGPFTSPYDNASEFDNQILVAGGIGITPAISVMRKHKDTRRSNLIWAVRDPHMLEFFLTHGQFSNRGWNLVFYTGKQALHLGDASEIVQENGAIVHIIRARPDMPNLLPNLIYSIESASYVPESYMVDAKVEALLDLREMLTDLDENRSDLTAREKLNMLINQAEGDGFLFTDLMADITNDPAIQELLEEKAKKEGAEEDEVDEDEIRDEIDVDDYIKPKKKGRSAMQDGTSILASFRLLQVPREDNDGSFSQQERNSLISKDGDKRDTLSRRISRMTLTNNRRQSSFGLNNRRQSSFGLVGGGGPSSRRGTNFGSNMFDGTPASRRGTQMGLNLIGDDMADFLKDGGEQFRPWSNDATEAKEFVKNLDKQSVLASWGVLYCGGKGPLATLTEQACKEYEVDLEIESFAW